jgi:stalled ribosome rescue protein Dom34
MTVHNHAVVWIDHRLARIFFLGLDAADELTIYSRLSSEHLHHKAQSVGSGNVHEDTTFFPRIDDALQHSEAILIVGPGNEKTLLLKHLKEAKHAPKGRELHAQACDHPTEREIIALGRRHFYLGEPAR